MTQNLISKMITRRKWAHMRACVDYGRAYQRQHGWLERRLRYDRLFREYLRIAVLMQINGHNLDI